MPSMSMERRSKSTGIEWGPKIRGRGVEGTVIVSLVLVASCHVGRRESLPPTVFMYNVAGVVSRETARFRIVMLRPLNPFFIKGIL